MDVPETKTIDEAKALKAEARSTSREPVEIMVRWITASTWDVDGDRFRVEANIQPVLDELGPGVYKVVVWANLDGERETVSEYSIFHETNLPSTQYAR